MNMIGRKVVAVVTVLAVCIGGGVWWYSRDKLGGVRMSWLTVDDKYHGLEFSYHPTFAPLDIQREFFPMAQGLCKKNARGLDALLSHEPTQQADFVRIKFEYGSGAMNFFHFADFAVDAKHVDCDKIYNGEPATVHPAPATL